jgi:hypothetical protein
MHVETNDETDRDGTFDTDTADVENLIVAFGGTHI